MAASSSLFCLDASRCVLYICMAGESFAVYETCQRVKPQWARARSLTRAKEKGNPINLPLFSIVEMVHRKRGSEKYAFLVGILKLSLPFPFHSPNSILVRVFFLHLHMQAVVKNTRQSTNTHCTFIHNRIPFEFIYLEISYDSIVFFIWLR